MKGLALLVHGDLFLETSSNGKPKPEPFRYETDFSGLSGPGSESSFMIADEDDEVFFNRDIGRTVGLWSEYIDAISTDPPRRDYTVLATPEPGSFPPLQPGEGITRARAGAVNAFLMAAIDLTDEMRAARFSVERYSAPWPLAMKNGPVAGCKMSSGMKENAGWP